MPLFSIPLSGLNASSTAMSTIANNLANLNTVGYKDGQTQFCDLFYQTIGTNGGGDPIQVGAGTAVSTTSMDLTAGSTESTGVPTDVAIDGDGYFVVQQDGVNSFTRAGNFTENNGFLETQDGQQVMGYTAVNGSIPSGAALAPLALDKGQINPASATTDVQITTNLDASASNGTPYSTPLAIYDSLGTAHTINFNFSKGSANAWNYTVTIPNADLQPPSGWAASQAYSVGTIVSPPTANGHTYECTSAGTSGASTPPVWPTDGSSVTDGGVTWQDMGTSTVLTQGSLTFDSNGKLLTPAGNVTGISSPRSLLDGASSLSLQWSLYNNSGSPLLSQVADSSSTSSQQQNGYGSGSLSSYSIQSDGTIMGSFSNGRTAALGQIALASFANAQGLKREGDNNFSATLASGSPVVGAPGAGGRGTLSGGSLELSNVDIAKEFSALIVAQRGYEANARTITTFDQIMQDTINLKSPA